MIKIAKIRDYILEANPQAQFADGFDRAIIGVSHRINMDPVIAYDFDICVDIIAKDMVVTSDDLEEGETINSKKYELALEYFYNNVLGSWVGDGTPIFVKTAINI